MRVKARKSLGQNFLINENITQLISESTKINTSDVLLEIGPGTGKLTDKLINRNPKKIYVIEKDKNLSDLLIKKYGDKINVINKDILDYDERLISSNNALIIFGNLPYNLSSQILIKQINNNFYFQNIKSMVLMFQKEVADRILAKVGNKNYSRISVISQLFFKIDKIKEIGPENFNPKPKINSSILSFYPKQIYNQFKDIENLQKITRIFFNERRKKIKKPFNLIFKDYKRKNLNFLDLNLRPQNLSPEDYSKITSAYEEIN
tara:strand:- start:26760 stop:27548 length:789 start_codon:yes stop_codon:yes gene_type:complete